MLESIIERGQWKTPKDTSRLRKITSIDNILILDFLDPNEMEVETEAIKNLYFNDPENILGVYSKVHDKSNESDHHEQVAIEEIVTIAASFGDDAICLKFNNVNKPPEVYVNDWSSGSCKWKKIANSFDEFYNYITNND